MTRHLGFCGLCQQEAPLRDSHFLPAALYKLCREPALKNSNPVMLANGIAMASSEQVRKRFLCDKCEGRFCDSGERWLLANCMRSRTEFPLYSSLVNIKPEISSDSMQLYSVAECDEIKDADIEYFAMSVFWRSAATEWPGCTKQELGPYEEQLREYLLGAPLPDHVALFVIVAPLEVARLLFVLPVSHRIGGMKSLTFAIPGIVFKLVTARHISDTYRTISLAPSKRRIMCVSGQEYGKLIAAIAGVARTATPKGSLISSPIRTLTDPIRAMQLVLESL